jgi:hypothetical protein
MLWRRHLRAHLVPTANPKRLTATANQPILAPMSDLCRLIWCVTPLALNTSDFWKLNDLIDALYVIVDLPLAHQDKAKRLIADIKTWLRAQN